MTLSTLAYQFILDINFVYQLFTTLATYIAIRLFLFFRVRQKRYKLFKLYDIPGPEPSLLNGNFRFYIQDPKNYLADEYWHAKYGKTYGVFLGDEPIITSTDLELLRGVFIDNGNSFKDRMTVGIENPVTESILFGPWHRWIVFRRLMSPLFSSYKVRCSKSMEFVENNIKLLLDYIEDRFDTKKGDENIELDVLDVLRATTLHMISHMAINLPDVKVESNEKHVRALDKFLGETNEMACKLIVLYPVLRTPIEFWGKHFSSDQAIVLVDRSLNATIDDRLKQFREKSDDQVRDDRLLDLLTRAHSKGLMTRSELISNCMSILIAGYDTTSTTLTYVFWALAKHTNVQHRLRSELMTYGTEAPYLDQVIDETMRLYPTVITFAARLATDTVKIGNLTIPKGTRVNYNSWLVHRDPEIWPEPQKFDPERFAPGVEYHPCAFAPFGLGARKCIGYHLAKLEMKMVICDILLRYKLSLMSPNELEIVTYSIFLSKPKEKVLVRLERLL